MPRHSLFLDRKERCQFDIEKSGIQPKIYFWIKAACKKIIINDHHIALCSGDFNKLIQQYHLILSTPVLSLCLA